MEFLSFINLHPKDRFHFVLVEGDFTVWTIPQRSNRGISGMQGLSEVHAHQLTSLRESGRIPDRIGGSL